jgi:prepilin-type N-terminal cleavage/methylation domain-containing protein
MLNKLRKTDQKGFTIIEVMIVLAIAGLIILIVLLAVPALQRNGRNTAIKNDASAVAAGISTYESNNDGTPPKYLGGTGTVTICDAATCSTTVTKETAKVQGATVVNSSASAPGATLTDPGSGKITVYLGYKCDNSASTRAAAVVYSLETANGNSVKCIDS